jgi:serine/threonine-protein kinase
MHGSAQPSAAPTIIGRYAIYDAIASGGMATVHLGRLVGPAGFSRTVAVKRLHPQLAQDRELAQMLLDEARLAARVQHPNVVPTLDVVAAESEMLLVMEYVRGDSLSRLLRAAQLSHLRLPPNVAVAIMLNTLAGLHAAHEATDERGQPLGLVHRDVSPQNVIVGVDGVARVLDFGIAKAEGRLVTTREGEVKGKVMYMAREQLAGEHVTRAADVYAAGIILYEMLTGARMFAGENEVAAVTRIVANDLRVPGQLDPSLAPFDAIVRRAAALHAQDRDPTAREMAREIERICAPASATVVGDWVQRLASERLDARARLVAEIERSTTRSRAVLAPMEEHPQPTSGVIPTARGPNASLPSFTGPMPLLPAAPAPASRGLGLGGAIALVVFFLLAGVGLTAIVLARGGVRPPPAIDAPPAAIVAPPAQPTELVREEPPTATAEREPEAAAPAPAAKPRAKPKCNPPYTIDAKGHKHFIPECLGQ